MMTMKNYHSQGQGARADSIERTKEQKTTVINLDSFIHRRCSLSSGKSISFLIFNLSAAAMQYEATAAAAAAAAALYSAVMVRCRARPAAAAICYEE